MTELRRRMIQDMELRALKENTKRAYLDAVKDLARHYGRSPDLLSEEELRRYFVNLTKTRRRSKSTLRVRLFGIKFLFKHTLRRPLPVFDLIRLPRDRKLPVVLSRQEVRQLLACIRRPEARMVALVMYSCGLRVTVASRLRAADIDSRRMMVCVRNGKGGKDQYVPLPQQTLELLRAYWREHRPGRWLFPDRSAGQPIDRCTVLKCIKAAAQDAKLTKPIGCHTLRHSYATHLLEDGVDLRTIQTLLGHRSIRSTVGYLHLTQQAMKNVHRSIDGLMADLYGKTGRPVRRGDRVSSGPTYPYPRPLVVTVYPDVVLSRFSLALLVVDDSDAATLESRGSLLDRSCGDATAGLSGRFASDTMPPTSEGMADE